MTFRSRRTLLAGGMGLLVLLAAGIPILLSQLGKGAGRLISVEASIDFGRVPHGEVMVRAVTVRNESPRDVTIKSAGANCACFEVDQSFSRYLHPGESTDIRVTFKSGIPPAGPLRGKRLAVVSDDAASALIEVPLVGDIIEILKVPEVIELGLLPPAIPEGASANLRATKTAKVRPGPAYRLKIVRWDLTGGDALDVTGTPAEGGMDFVVSVKPGATGKGPLLAAITMQLELTAEEGPASEVKVRKATRTLNIKGEWQP
jgi:hypothetical protein